MKVLELFSGIGGMHWALSKTDVSYEIIAAVDINVIANKVYKHNFKETKVLQKNIQSFSPEYINNLGIEMILMSPPCQPFTRVGLKKDVLDNRTTALSHIIDIIPHLTTVKYILLENVRGFECSEARNLLIEALKRSDYTYQEFIISPLQFRIPNSRERYYLIAKRKPLSFSFETQIQVMTTIPNVEDLREGNWKRPMMIRDILEIEDEDCEEYKSYLVAEGDLKRAWIMDVVGSGSEKSCCFTKAYSHYAEGTGSVFCPRDPETAGVALEASRAVRDRPEEAARHVAPLGLRYFTPREILRLMSFPEVFEFPPDVTRRQKYRLLGNSINIAIVSQLIKLLCEDGTD